MTAKMHKSVFRLPRIGGAETEARVLVWKKAAGESFLADETLVEVETDKAVVEVPAPAAGIMGRTLKAVDDYAAFDEPLAEIEAAAGALAAFGEPPLAAEARGAQAATTAAAGAEHPGPDVWEVTAGSVATAATTPPAPTGRIFASPAARKLARESAVDLAGLRGSGVEGRIVRKDVERRAESVPAGGNSRMAEESVRTSRGDVHVRRWNAAAGAHRATFVLIHGLFGDSDAWAGLAKSLADAGRPVLALDLPVHGRTSANAETLDDLVAVVAEVLLSRVPGRKVMVGHSLGGAVAVKLANAMSAGNIEALALIAPAGMGTEIDQGFVDGMLHAGSPALLRREIDKLTHRPQPFGEAGVAAMHEALRARSPALQALVSRFAVRGVQQVDVRPALESLRMPIFVFWGRLDRIIPWQHALNLPPSVSLHLFADAGHMPQWENGSVVSQALLRLSPTAP